MRKEVSRLSEELGINEDDVKSEGSEMVSEQSEDDDYVDELPKPSHGVQKKQRTSVSAEAFGDWNKKEDFEPIIIPKSEEVKEKIKDKLLQAFMFNALSEKELQIVIDAMKEI